VAISSDGRRRLRISGRYFRPLGLGARNSASRYRRPQQLVGHGVSPQRRWQARLSAAGLGRSSVRFYILDKKGNIGGCDAAFSVVYGNEEAIGSGLLRCAEGDSGAEGAQDGFGMRRRDCLSISPGAGIVSFLAYFPLIAQRIAVSVRCLCCCRPLGSGGNLFLFGRGLDWPDLGSTVCRPLAVSSFMA
jgi:hypothetical protein